MVSLKDVLSRTHVNRKCVFCILEQYSAEQYDAQIFGQSVKTISNRKKFGFHDILNKIKVCLPIDVRGMPLLELPIERRNEETMLSQN